MKTQTQTITKKVINEVKNAATKLPAKTTAKMNTKERLEGRRNYGILTKYPHLGKKDTIVWEAFVLQNPNKYDVIDYDYHLGIGQAGLEDDTDPITQGWKQLKHLKADVVAYGKDGTIDIYEIKPSTGAAGLGQIIAYGILYNQDFPERKIKLHLLTLMIHDDIRNIAKRLGINVIVV